MTGTLPMAIGLSYLVGAIPTSYLVVRLARGVDLRTVGSGNLGATNLFRLLGWRYAVPVGLFDMLKGAFPVVVLGPWLGTTPLGAVGLGLVAVLGHVFSVFVGFRGGKGVATGSGIILGLAPWAFVVSLVIWLLSLKLSGYVSLGSILGAMALPPAIWLLHPERREIVWPMAALSLLIVWFHRANIGRLVAGTELRFGRPRPEVGQ